MDVFNSRTIVDVFWCSSLRHPQQIRSRSAANTRRCRVSFWPVAQILTVAQIARYCHSARSHALPRLLRLGIWSGWREDIFPLITEVLRFGADRCHHAGSHSFGGVVGHCVHRGAPGPPPKQRALSATAGAVIVPSAPSIADQGQAATRAKDMSRSPRAAATSEGAATLIVAAHGHVLSQAETRFSALFCTFRSLIPLPPLLFSLC